MKDYQRPVLTLKCCGTGATVLSSVLACQAPKSHPLMRHKEEANVSTTGEEQGLSSSRKIWEVPAWAFQWGALSQTEMTLCSSSNVYGFWSGTVCSPLRLSCKKSFALGGVRPASRPWKPLISASFQLIIAGS